MSRTISAVFIAAAIVIGMCGLAPAGDDSLVKRVAVLESQVATLQSQVSSLQTALATVQANPVLSLGPYVSVDPNPENGLKGPNVIVKAANVHIESGSGSTVDTTGLGNLVVGYDEDLFNPSAIDSNRTGSHNLIVGPQHEFTASGGLVAGFSNFVSAPHGVAYGECNAAGSTAFPFLCLLSVTVGKFDGASVSGGHDNTANGFWSSVGGGTGNTASGTQSTVSGGAINTASGDSSSVGGGAGQTASGTAQNIN